MGGFKGSKSKANVNVTGPGGMSTLSLKAKIKDNNELDLSLMGLTSVPLATMHSFCQRLSKLDFSDNKLKDLGLDFATSLVQLNTLDLSRNSLVSLPENFGLMTNMVHLDLFKNEIQRLPLSMGEMTKLRWLDIKDNQLVPVLEQVCGPCCSAAECQTCAKDLVNFMQHLGSQITTLEESEVEVEEEVNPPSRAYFSNASVKSKSSKAVSVAIREVISPSDLKCSTDSETDKGSTDEDSDVLAPAKPVTSNQSAGNRRRPKRKNPSKISVANESRGNVKTGGSSKTECQLPGKKSIKSIINPVPTDSIGERLKEKAKYWADYCGVKPSKQTLMKLVRSLLYVSCLYVSTNVLLGIALDANYIRYFFEDFLNCAGVGSLVLPIHEFFQNTMQLGCGGTVIPMVRFPELTDSPATPNTLSKCYSFLTGLF